VAAKDLSPQETTSWTTEYMRKIQVLIKVLPERSDKEKFSILPSTSTSGRGGHLNDPHLPIGAEGSILKNVWPVTICHSRFFKKRKP
jgi:hypothetical protein